jgi:TolB-like protein/DNA-binding winged helix-turn-helix (wHTH) protein/tetratricopeptide (TPR) repeat protein
VPLQLQHSVRFGDDFELDPRAHELRRAGRPLKLERIPLKVLCLLLENPGQLITRDQILAAVWGSDVHMDTDNSINGAIRKLRQVLGDSCDQPRFISTVSGEGYRFIAPVQDPVEPAAEPPHDPVALRRGWKHRIFFRSNLAIAVGLIVLLSALAAIAYLSKPRSAGVMPTSSARTMIAVLPFENLTGDSSQEYFSDGMTEEMIAELTGLDPQRFGVIARTSVMHYKANHLPLAQIARELGVQYVVEGSVRRDPERVRVTAQLIQVKDQTHLWSRNYDRELDTVVTVQDDIARAISSEISQTLGGRDVVPMRRVAGTTSYEAFDLYLKGLYFWNKRTSEGFARAAEYFKQAIDKDPNYAQAYAGLADTYGLMSTWYLAPQKEFMPKARAAALKALAINDRLAEAHTALALVTENYDYDWRTTETEFRRAIELSPDYATAHQWYAEFLSWQGRFDEAFAESERARQLDPLSTIIASDYASILYYSRQSDRLVRQCRSVLEMDSNASRCQWLLFLTYVSQARCDDAQQFVPTAYSQDDAPSVAALKAFLYGRCGHNHDARAALKDLAKLEGRLNIQRVPILLGAYLGVNANDQTMKLLEEAYSQHSNAVVALKVDPMYDALRSDPRFQDLLHRLTLDR